MNDDPVIGATDLAIHQRRHRTAAERQDGCVWCQMLLRVLREPGLLASTQLQVDASTARGET